MLKRKCLKGSFTIEVSLLMPFLVAVILLLLYFTMYMYNRGVMQSAVCRGTKQIFYNMTESNDEIEKACTQVIMADLENNMVAMKDISLSVEVTSKKVNVLLEGMLNVPELFIWKSGNLGDLWKISVEWCEPRLHPAEMIRNGQQIEGILDAVQESNG